METGSLTIVQIFWQILLLMQLLICRKFFTDFREEKQLFLFFVPYNFVLATIKKVHKKEGKDLYLSSVTTSELMDKVTFYLSGNYHFLKGGPEICGETA